MRGGQPISPNAYSGRMRNLANSVLCIEARPTSQPDITSPVGKSQYTTVHTTVHHSIPQCILQYITVYHSAYYSTSQYTTVHTTVHHSILQCILQYITVYYSAYYSTSQDIIVYYNTPEEATCTCNLLYCSTQTFSQLKLLLPVA